MLFLPEACGFIGETAAQTLSNGEPPTSSQSSEISIAHESSLIAQQLRETVQRCCEQGQQEKLDSNDPSDVKDLASSDPSLLQCLQIISRESNMWMSIGGMHVLRKDGDEEEDSSEAERVFNTHIILDPTGKVEAEYRKIHLFDVDIPGKVRLKESNTTAPGRNIVLCDTPFGRLGLSTCYDVRFPELYVKLVEQGAEIILVPSAFTVPTGHAHWHTLLRARAIESQCYVIASAQCGSHNAKRTSYGHSLVVDPWGEIIVDAGGVDSGETETPTLVTADIDLSQLISIRQRMPIHQHRKNAADY